MHQRSFTFQQESYVDVNRALKRAVTFTPGHDVEMTHLGTELVKIQTKEGSVAYVKGNICDAASVETENTCVDEPESTKPNETECVVANEDMDDMTNIISSINGKPEEVGDLILQDLPLKCSTPPPTLLELQQVNQIESLIQPRTENTDEGSDYTDMPLRALGSAGWEISTTIDNNARERLLIGRKENYESSSSVTFERITYSTPKQQRSIHKSLKDVINRANKNIYHVDTFKVHHKAGLSRAAVGLPSLHPKASIRKLNNME